MDFEPTSEQQRLVQRATAFASDAAAALPRDGTGFATEACAALGARGHFAVASAMDAVLVTIALGRVSAALGATFASAWLFIDALRRYGADSATLHAIGTGAAAGTLTGAVVLGLRATAGSELTASEEGGGVVFNGRTASAALVPVASDALVVARLATGGVVLACIDLATPGVHRAAASASLGLEGLPRGTLGLGGATAPRERVLVTGTDGLKAADSLARGRSILFAAAAVGVAGGALDRALSHVRAHGKIPQSTEFIVSDLATGYDVAFYATAHAAWLQDRGAECETESASAKLLAARTASEICHGALSVCGEAGYGDDLRRSYLDARHLELYDGTEAEQIDVIASQMLGES